MHLCGSKILSTKSLLLKRKNPIVQNVPFPEEIMKKYVFTVFSSLAVSTELEMKECQLQKVVLDKQDVMVIMWIYAYVARHLHFTYDPNKPCQGGILMNNVTCRNLVLENQ